MQKEVKLVVGKKEQELLAKAKNIPGKLHVAVVCPLNEEAILGAILADEMNFARPIFIGPKHEMEKIAKNLNRNLSSYEVIDAPDALVASKIAVDLAKEDKVHAIVKGPLETSILLGAVLAKDGIRGSSRISNCYVCDVPLYHKMIIYTDVGINIAPDLKTKKDIILNAINVAKAIGIQKPKIALLSCIEKVNENIPSTTDAKALCEMAKNGDFGDVIMEGPLSFDIAISMEIAQIKGISSKVAGDPDIVIFPNLDAGNIAVKQLEIFSLASCGSLALGAKVPILITSRHTPASERAFSLALAKIYFHSKKS